MSIEIRIESLKFERDRSVRTVRLWGKRVGTEMLVGSAFNIAINQTFLENRITETVETLPLDSPSLVRLTYWKKCYYRRKLDQWNELILLTVLLRNQINRGYV